MADAVTNVAAVSQDVLNVWIARQTYALAERRLQLGKFASRYTLPQRMGKTMRIVRYRRLNLPTATLTEGVPPDAVALSVENVDVTVEQWGIVVLITDVAQVVPTHPALQMAIERTGMAMSELLERETATVLMGGTNVFYGGAATSRAALVGTDIVATGTILKVLSSLRSKGATEFASGQFGGVMPPQVVSDVLASDSTFRDATGQSAYEKMEYGVIGDWMNVRWVWGNFLPIYKTVPAPTAAAATAEKAQITTNTTGGSFPNAVNYKFAVVGRDAKTGYERKISLPSANIASAAATTGVFIITVPTSTNYVYDVYMTTTAGAGAGNLYKISSAQVGPTITLTAPPVGTEAVAPAGPTADQTNVFTTFVFGKGAFGRVELDGMSLQSYLTEAGASYSNPLAQGRKVGSKIMWKCFIIDNDFYARIESGSAYSADLPA